MKISLWLVLTVLLPTYGMASEGSGRPSSCRENQETLVEDVACYKISNGQKFVVGDAAQLEIPDHCRVNTRLAGGQWEEELTAETIKEACAIDWSSVLPDEKMYLKKRKICVMKDCKPR